MRRDFFHTARIKALCCITLSIATTATGGAWAADWSDLLVTVGAKAWANEWTSWTPVPGGGDAGVQVIESVSANTHVAAIPQASVRYGDWLVAGSYFANTTYSLGGVVNAGSGLLESLNTSRKEFDGNVGYYILPSLAVTAGYKQIEQDFGIDHYKWSGPTVGLAASAPLKGSLGLYGTFAYGRLSMKASVADVTGRDSFNADYLLGELGLPMASPRACSGFRSLRRLVIGFKS
jgi:hypothetical protein